MSSDDRKKKNVKDFAKSFATKGQIFGPKASTHTMTNTTSNIDDDTQNAEETPKLASSVADPSAPIQEEPVTPTLAPMSAFASYPAVYARSETNKRGNNEDSYLVLQLMPPRGSPVHVLAVADGMGGHEHGELVSREALLRTGRHLFETLVLDGSCGPLGQETFEPDLLKILGQVLELANFHVRKMMETNRWGRAGSTLVIAVVWEGRCFVANLGDSPLMHYAREAGTLTQVTDDHTIAGALLRSGAIDEELARVHEGRSQLEFFIGCSNLPNSLPVKEISIAEGDMLLLCSDGISGALKLDDIRDSLNSSASLSDITARLLDRSTESGETDNQTVVLMRYTLNIDAIQGSLVA